MPALFSRRAWPGRLLVIAVVCVLVVWNLLCSHIDALKAAGLAGGSAIGGVSGFFSALTGNLTWLGVTVIGFAITLIGILFLSGHSRAHDIALKVGIGIFLLVAAPGIVS